MNNYVRGLLVAFALDLVCVAGTRSLAPVAVPATQVASADSLMQRLQENPVDAAAMEALARVYAAQGRPAEAIGPLARALQIDPRRRALWVVLDRALAASGRSKITDAELVRAAREFVEAVDMARHGC